MYTEEEYQALERAYFSPQPHEEETLALTRKLLKRATTFVDIGASLGQFTRCAAETMRDGRVVAMEADPGRYSRLESNCRKWAARASCSIEPMHAAVSDRDGPITFFTTDSRVSGGLFTHDTSDAESASHSVDWREVRVPGIRLDSLFPAAPPDLVKIDVEGAELRVLSGARAILERRRTIFLVEIHPWKDPGGQKDPREVLALMRSFGFVSLHIAGKTVFVPRKRWTRWLPLVIPSLWWRLRSRLRRRAG